MPTYSVSGTILDAQGTPLAGATVATSIGSATTDSVGAFSIDGHAATGTYTLTPTKSGYSFNPATRSLTFASANLTGQNFIASTQESGDITTLELVKEFLGITDTSKDTFLRHLITRASRFIKTYTGREYASTTYTEEVHSGNGYQKLYLDHYPIISVTEVKEDDVALDSDEYEILSEEGAIFREAGWTGGSLAMADTLSTEPDPYAETRNLKVTYTAGWASIPDDIVQACLQLVALWYTGANSAGIERETTPGGYSVTYGKAVGVPDDIKLILDQYKKVFV